VTDDEITDFNYILSAVGNAFWSGLTFDELWDCISVSYTREDLDAAVSAAIRLKEIVSNED
jgi:hypothetical protein